MALLGCWTGGPPRGPRSGPEGKRGMEFVKEKDKRGAVGKGVLIDVFMDVFR